ncbi:MAG: hypothetical protein B7Z52_00380 [Burkholderiales bacterium 12-64-5]|nr:MAG: hypothetical protein B7Z52_00380 [Burkholderiales bacterium 12-64-5]
MLRRWLQDNFGRLSKNKYLPVWLYGLQRSWRLAFLRSYCEGDGHLQTELDGQANDKQSASTASRKLAIGIRLLATSLDYAVSLHYRLSPNSEIRGREIKGGPSYTVVWVPNNAKQTSFSDSRHCFTPVKKLLPGYLRRQVYCLEVEEDASFVADGIVVHNCTHFSRARGSKPVRKKIRSLAWVVCKWARELKPRIICLENVREFADYGPTTAQLQCGRCDWTGTESTAKLYRKRPACPRCNSVRLTSTGLELPHPEKKGLTFNRWVGYLRAAGYDVQWREMNAADYGAATNRRRLFVIARRDGKPIVWPEPTHCSPKKPVAGRKPWRGACEFIDFSLPCPSIFNRPKGPLVEKTMRRVAFGIKRYVLENPKPFIVGLAHGDSPGGGDRVRDIKLPLGTVLQSNNEALVSAVLMPLTHSGERRTPEVTEPLPTITTAHRGEFGLVTAFLAKHFGGVVGTEVTNPLPTTTQRGTQTQLAAVSLQRYYGNSVGQEVTDPAPTATGENKTALLAATLVQTGYGERDGQAPRTLDLEAPLGTVVAGGVKHALAAATLIHFNHGDKQWSSVEEPLRTITSGNHAALVYSLLKRYTTIFPDKEDSHEGVKGSAAVDIAGGARSASGRDDLEAGQTDQRSGGDPGRAKESYDKVQGWLSTVAGELCESCLSALSASCGLAFSSGTDPEEDVRKPQKREQVRQSSRKSRGGDAQSELTARLCDWLKSQYESGKCDDEARDNQPSKAGADAGGNCKACGAVRVGDMSSSSQGRNGNAKAKNSRAGSRDNQAAARGSFASANSETAKRESQHGNKLLAACLVKYFGTAIGQSIEDPLGTLTSKDRYGLVLVHVEGEPYVIVDIGMRMLTPRELASCQGFPADYWLPPKKTHAVAKIGNSVPPCLAEAIVRANYVETKSRKKVACG